MIAELDMQAWEAFDARRPAPTFFARPAWARALADAYPALIPAPLEVRHHGRRYIVPTMRARTRLPFRSHTAFPMGGYTAVLDEQGNAASPAQAGAVIGILASKFDRFHITPWPLAPIDTVACARVAAFETAVIDCSGGYERAINGMRGVTRRMAGQAQRRGVECSRAGVDQLDRYYQILHDASLSWGRTAPSISARLLHAVFARGGDDAQLWFAQAQGQTLGGGVVLFGSRELFFWSAAMRREHARFRPSNALNLRLIALACERGVRWYNLGASEGLEGVARFKHDLGATGVGYEQLTFQRFAFTCYELARTKLARQRSA